MKMLPDPTAPDYKPGINWGGFFAEYKAYCEKYNATGDEVSKVFEGFFKPGRKNGLWDGFLNSLKG